MRGGVLPKVRAKRSANERQAAGSGSDTSRRSARARG